MFKFFSFVFVHKGDINHDMILDFPYVDNVIHEVLRMNSPVPRSANTF